MSNGPREGHRSSVRIGAGAELPPVPRAASRGPETVINPEGRQPSTAVPSLEPLAAPASTIVRLLFPPTDEIPDETRLKAAVGAQLGHFTIVERIRTGGMGAVFQALDTRLNRIVALKVLPPLPSRDPSAVQRFRKEAQAAAQLNHENIARVYYIGEDQGLHFIAFEFVHGTNLRDLISQNGQFQVEDALNYTLQVASALAHTSAQGVVHRDIKPSNIIITPTGRAKLVDLGLARNESRTEGEPDLTVAGTTLGTFDYISPEQARDPRTADIRSDIYSLGCTLYHLLTAEPPYPQGTMLQKLLQHQGDEAPDPAQKNRRVPAPLSAIVRKMMAKDPRRRYQTADQLIRDLMILASAMGLQSTSPEGLVWVSPQTPKPSFVERHIAWILCVVALLVAVGFLEWGGPNRRVASTPPDRRVEPWNPSVPTPPVENPTPKSNDSKLPKAGDPKVPVNTKDAAPPAEQKKPEVATTVSGPTTGTPVRELGPESTDVTSLGPPPVQFDASGSSVSSPASTGNGSKPGETLPEISILGADNNSRQSFTTLAAACSEAKDGAIIELRFNGRRDEFPFRITRKVTIRAASGFRPVIGFVPREIPAERYQTRMITLSKGSLHLIGVDLSMTVQENIPAEFWSLFLIQKAESLKLQSCQLTLLNARQLPAAVCEIQGGTSPVMPEAGMEEPVPLQVEFYRSFTRSQGDLICLKSLDGVHISLKETLAAVDGTVLLNQGYHGVASSSSSVSLEIDHSTLAFTRSLLRVDTGDLPQRVLPVRATVSRGLLSSSTPEPLVFLTGKTPASDLRSLVSWKGEENQYDRIQNFWSIASTDSGSRSETADFAGWQRLSVATGESTSKVEPANWKQPWDGKSLPTLTINDFALSNANLEEPPESAPGAPLGQLPGAQATPANRPSPSTNRAATTPRSDEKSLESP